jgi:hypothetical protein
MRAAISAATSSPPRFATSKSDSPGGRLSRLSSRSTIDDLPLPRGDEYPRAVPANWSIRAAGARLGATPAETRDGPESNVPAGRGATKRLAHGRAGDEAGCMNAVNAAKSQLGQP